jgi:hypothetical protein
MFPRWIVSSFTVCALAVGAACADVITFEAFPSGPFASHTEQGVTFSAVGGGGLIIRTGTPNGTKGLLETHSPRRLLRADIGGGATFVSVDLGDYNADSDRLRLEIFDAANISLGFTSLNLPSSFVGMKTLSLSAPNIAYAIFGADMAVNGSSVYADNFTWEPASSAGHMPEPASLSVLALGALAAFRRRTESV